MSSPQFILDTDILSLLMRKNAVVLAKAGAYLSGHRQFTISIITRYEILRGLKAKDALRQAERFEDFCATNKILSIDYAVILQAADIYADRSCVGLGQHSAGEEHGRPHPWSSGVSRCDEGVPNIARPVEADPSEYWLVVRTSAVRPE